MFLGPPAGPETRPLLFHRNRERGPFLEGNLGGTKRHATVRDDLFRRESPPKVVHERGATFAHVFGSGKREEIAPLSLLSLLSLSSLSSVSSLSSLRSN